MSTELTTATKKDELPALPVRAVLPPMSDAMKRAIWLVGANRAPSEDSQTEARSLLEAHARMIGPPKEAQVMNWLARVNLGMSKVLPPKELEVRSLALVPALMSLPAAAFTVETAQAATLHFEWFQGAAMFAKFLEEQIAPVRQFARWLQKVATFAADSTPPRPPPDEAEIAAVAAATAQILALRSGDAEPQRAVHPSFLSPEQLAAYRQRAGCR